MYDTATADMLAHHNDFQWTLSTECAKIPELKECRTPMSTRANTAVRSETTGERCVLVGVAPYPNPVVVNNEGKGRRKIIILK